MSNSEKPPNPFSESTPQLRLLNMEEVAERLNVSIHRAYELGRNGLLPVVHLGRQLRVEERRLLAWIEAGGQALPGGWKRTATKRRSTERADPPQ